MYVYLYLARLFHSDYISLPIIMHAGYCIMFDMIDRSGEYIRCDAVSHRVQLQTFRQLLDAAIPVTARKLQDIGALEERHLNLIFVRIFRDIFSVEEVKNIVSLLSFDFQYDCLHATDFIF
jgi:hypothetical protein